MATIIFTIPDGLLPLLTEAFCSEYNYRAQIPDPANPGQVIPNPVGSGEFAQQKFVDYGKEVVRGYAIKRAAAEAAAAAAASAASTLDDADITVTLQ